MRDLRSFGSQIGVHGSEFTQDVHLTLPKLTGLKEDDSDNGSLCLDGHLYVFFPQIRLQRVNYPAHTFEQRGLRDKITQILDLIFLGAGGNILLLQEWRSAS